MISLRARLSFWLAASLVVLLALQWSVASVVIEQLVERQLVSRLVQDAESLLAGTNFPSRSLRLDPARVSAVYQRPLSGHYYLISTENETEFSRSLWDTPLHVPHVRPGGRVFQRLQGPANQPLLMAAFGYRKQGQEITIAVAEDLTEANAGLRQFRLIHGVISFFILIALLGLQYFIVTRSLWPLQKVHADMRRLESGKIERIEVEDAPLEVLPLISELNRLLAAMGRKTRRSREATGNLAHALKTQLALLGQAVERPQMDRYPEMQATLRDIGEGMRRIIERELKRSRLVGSAMPGKRVDLGQEVDALMQVMRKMYDDKGIAIEWRVADDASYGGDREDMLELLGNLLDNACKWCEKRVRLEIEVNAALMLVIEDDGPGCKAGEMEELTRRGFRLDETKPGSGLGLAIVKDIVDSYGGTISFSTSPSLKGLRVEVSLPRVEMNGRT